MSKANQNFDIEQELEKLRHQLKPNPQGENQVSSQQQVPKKRKARKNLFPTGSLVAIAVLGFGLGAMGIMGWKTWVLAKAKTTIVEAEKVDHVDEISTLTKTKQSLQDAIANLEKIPTVLEFSDQEASLDLMKLRSLLFLVDQNLQATENLASAENLAIQAATIVQSPPHPLNIWQQAEIDWNQAIFLLEKIPPSTSVAETAQKKLLSYRSNQDLIHKRVEIARQAVDFNNQGAETIKTRNYQKAIQFFTQAINLNAALAEAYYGRGMAYSELGNKSAALLNYNQAIQSNSDFAEAYFSRGRYYYDTGDRVKAMADFEQTIRVNPNYAIAYLERGAIRYQLGMQSTGISDFQKASELCLQQGDLNNYQLAQNLLMKFNQSSPANSPEEKNDKIISPIQLQIPQPKTHPQSSSPSEKK